MKSLFTLIKSSLFVVLAFLSVSAFAQQSYSVQTSGASAFIPSSLTINVGDTVVWTNTGGSHNVNGTLATYPSNPESFGGFPVSNGAPNWPFTHVFTTAGSYDYRCDPHVGNGMAGTIQVNAVPTPCSDLFFSEYLEGASNNKAIEIYNPTSSAVTLSNYSVLRDNNGGTTSTDTFQLDGTLSPGDVYVIANSGAALEILNVADTTSSSTFYNGNDALRLLNNSSGLVIDVVGEYGVDSTWVFTGTNGVSGETGEFDLVRDPSVNSGNNSWTTVVINQWYVFPRENFNNLGVHNAQVCGSTIPAYLIEQLKGLDATLSPDSLAVQAQLTAIVHNPDQGFNSSEFAMQDGSAGIWVTGADPIPGYPSGTNEGDVIRVFGTVDFGNGVIEFAADSINLLGNTSLYTPEQTDTLNEFTEGRYVKLDSVRIFNSPQDTFDIAAVSSSGANFTIITQQMDTFTMRVDRDYEANFDGNPVPTGLFNVTGVGSQFDGLAPHNSGYQIFPSRYSDLEILTVSGDVIGFSSAGDVVDENAGTYQIMITTSDTLAAVATVDVVNTGNGSAVSGTDFTFNDTTLTFSTTSIDTFLLDVTVIDNSVINPDRTVEFALRNITSASFGLDTLFTLTIVNDDVPTYDIGTIRGNDNLGGTTNVGVADSLGVTCRVYALVTTPDIGGSNRSVTLQDATGGISIFQPGSANPPALNVGDSVEIVGEIGQFNGLSQFTNSTVINVISSGNALPAPMLVDSLGEFTESKLLRMNNMSFVDASVWTNNAGLPSSSGFNIDILSGVDTFTLRVDSDLPIYNQLTPPTEPFDLICFGGQFDNSAPYTNGYQVLAIDSAGFMPVVPFVASYSIPSVTSLNSDGVADSVGIECRLVGIAYGENFRASANGLEFTLVDTINNNAGIAVFSSTSLGYTVNEGDQLRVIGTIDQVFGLTRIVADSIAVESSGNSLKTPSVVTNLNEFSESNLVEYRDLMYMSEGSWTNSGSGFNVRFTDGSDTITVRIDNDCDLFGSAEPADSSIFDVTGIGSQVDLTSPFNSDYLLLPRRSSDLDNITGLNKYFTADNLRVFPNPSQGQVTIQGLSNNPTEIQVLDLLGRVVFTTEVNSNSASINLSELNSGQYIVISKSARDIQRSVLIITK